jgi:superfamily II DNA or RNA helicase
MAFNKEEIRYRYSTDKNNVLKDFYIPVLRESVLYDRAVVHFSSQGLLKYLQGIDGLVENNGKMRLIIGDTLTDDEYLAIRNSNDYEDVFERLDSTWSDILNHNQFEELEKYRLEIFSWLLNRGFLEIRYAFRRQGLLQQKIGIATDDEGSVIAFSSPISEAQIVHRPNKDNPSIDSEEFPIFPSWMPEVFELYGKPYVEDFEELWASKDTVDLPSRQYEEIKKIYTSEDAPKSEHEHNAAELYERWLEDSKSVVNKGYPYKLKKPQKAALAAWEDNKFKGILALATGVGKTIAAIHAAKKISESGTLCVIIAVPYLVLADQWVDVLAKYGITPHRCYGGIGGWHSDLSSAVGDYNLGINKFLPIIVVNYTLRKREFQEQLKKIEKSRYGEIFMISDECHHHANHSLIKKLPKAMFIMGLSATPWNKKDKDSRVILEKYYGRIVYEYPLDRAIREKILCPYSYYIHEVEMSENEEDEYLRLTKIISPLTAQKYSGGLSSEQQSILDNTIFARARMLDGIEDKFNVLDQILKSRKSSPYKLFYCGSGSQFGDKDDADEEIDGLLNIDRITKILSKNDWYVSQFTHKTSPAERKTIIKTFKDKSIHAIAAIKVLDEGFDVPMCDEAFITASSNSERQWVQRRGRILRISDNKESAVVHDFVITKTSDPDKFQKLVRNEMDRVESFFSSCSNQEDIKYQIEKIKQNYAITEEESEDA